MGYCSMRQQYRERQRDLWEKYFNEKKIRAKLNVRMNLDHKLFFGGEFHVAPTTFTFIIKNDVYYQWRSCSRPEYQIFIALTKTMIYLYYVCIRDDYSCH
jgi:hypothetical protein